MIIHSTRIALMEASWWKLHLKIPIQWWGVISSGPSKHHSTFWLYVFDYSRFNTSYKWNWASQVALVVKNLPANAGNIRDTGSIPGSGRSLERGHGNPLQYSCLENPMDRGAWQAIVHRVAKIWTRLKWFSMRAYISEFIQYLSFCDWSISFSIMFSRFICYVSEFPF